MYVERNAHVTDNLNVGVTVQMLTETITVCTMLSHCPYNIKETWVYIYVTLQGRQHMCFKFQSKAKSHLSWHVVKWFACVLM